MVAPSDMMDNRIAAIKNALKAKGLSGRVRTVYEIYDMVMYDFT